MQVSLQTLPALLILHMTTQAAIESIFDKLHTSPGGYLMPVLLFLIGMQQLKGNFRGENDDPPANLYWSATTASFSTCRTGFIHSEPGQGELVQGPP